ncbi:MAG: hypothetical protein WCJ60_03475 [bacterium]
MDKIKNQIQISVSNDGFVDEGDGLISFPNGLTITDDTVMRSGTRYDISSLDISNYGGQLTADHEDSLETLIGKTVGVVKESNRIIVNAIKYAVKENPYARLAYDLLVGGFSNSFSIETIGAYPDQQDLVYRNHELVGLSQVVVPNNYNAKINQFNEMVHNSLERSQRDGLDTKGIEEKIFSSLELVSSEVVKEESMAKDKEMNASEIEASPVVDIIDNSAEIVETEVVKTEAEAPAEAKVENEAEAEVKTEAEAEVMAEEVEVVANEVAVEDVQVEETETEEEVVETESEEEVENNINKNEEILEMTAEQIAEIVANAIKPLVEELSATKELAQNAIDTQAKEPAFEKVEEVVANSYDGMSADELFAKQLNAAVAVERLQSVEGSKVLAEINARNLNALKDAKIVNASVSLADLGNFVIGPELYNQVATARTDYSAILGATQWKETSSIEFGWITRTSDIDMTSVALGISTDNGSRLKPVSNPAYGAHTGKLEEMAAVTPISINVIKFAAADILSDVAEGYRNDYDRKRAQLVIARLQQAVDATGNKQTFDISDGLLGWAAVVAKISDATTIGTLIFNSKTLAALKGQAIATLNAAVLTEIASGAILGTPFIVVPNDLMPTINTTETKSFTVSGVAVTIDTAVFYGDLRTFTGRTSGGLKYDVDGSASYEIAGTVYSAYQRNEIVLRGSFFRGGVVKDTSVVASIPAVAVS